MASKTLDPVEVHKGERMFGGHAPAWASRPYDGGPYDHSHYRQCTYCGSIHPEDMISLLRLGESQIVSTTKGYKRYLVTPNPIAGQEGVNCGSRSGPVYQHQLVGDDSERRLNEYAPKDLTEEELALGHYKRVTLGKAPSTIQQKFYLNHTHTDQWQDIVDAAVEGFCS